MRYGLFNEQGFMVAGPYPDALFGKANEDAFRLKLAVYDFWGRQWMRDYRANERRGVR